MTADEKEDEAAMAADLHNIKLEGKTQIAWDQIVNILGYQPDLLQLNSYLEERGFFMSAAFVWSEKTCLLRRSGRKPTRREIFQTTGGGQPRPMTYAFRAARLKRKG